MPREDFENNLKVVQDDLIQLSSMVEKSVFKSIDALRNRDIAASQQVIDDDDAIDEKQQDIENRCIELIALTIKIIARVYFLVKSEIAATFFPRKVRLVK